MTSAVNVEGSESQTPPRLNVARFDAVHSSMLSQHTLELCTSSTTVISEIAKEPDQPVSRVARRLSKNHGALFKQRTNAPPPEDNEDEFGIVAKCGRFPRRPSNLFLQVFLYHILVGSSPTNHF